jgi:hypothetical protein
MKSVIALVVALLAALAYHFFVPVSFMTGNPTISGLIFGALVVIPIVIAASPITDKFEEGTFLGKYGVGAIVVGSIIVAMLGYSTIKEGKVNAAMAKSGMKTIAIVKDGEQRKSRRGGTTCNMTVTYTVNGQPIEASSSISEAEWKSILGIGQPIEIAYNKEDPSFFIPLLTAESKEKYKNLPEDKSKIETPEIESEPKTETK